MGHYIGAVDLGTTSNRFIIFDRQGRIVGLDQKEHEQIFPRPGWVEHDPVEIWNNTCSVIRGALGKTGIKGGDIAAIGITNQRETTVVWNRQCHCLAVHAHGRHLQRPHRRRRPGPLSRQDGPARRYLFFRA